MLNHEPLRLADGEYRFACLVWDNEPLPSGQLVALAAEGLGWKKSTTYTVLKKLCERGVLQNADGRVTSLIKKEDVQQAESAAVVDKTFDGSLPRFVAAFLNSKRSVSMERDLRSFSVSGVRKKTDRWCSVPEKADWSVQIVPGIFQTGFRWTIPRFIRCST